LNPPFCLSDILVAEPSAASTDGLSPSEAARRTLAAGAGFALFADDADVAGVVGAAAFPEDGLAACCATILCVAPEITINGLLSELTNPIAFPQSLFTVTQATLTGRIQKLYNFVTFIVPLNPL
jgi:hypothetical protein